MESLLQQATFGKSAHGRWRGATNVAPERVCRCGYVALDLTGAVKIANSTRANTNCRNGKRKHAPIRRSVVELRDAAEAKGASKFEKKKERNVRTHDDVDDRSWDGKIADENLMPAR